MDTASIDQICVGATQPFLGAHLPACQSTECGLHPCQKLGCRLGTTCSIFALFLTLFVLPLRYEYSLCGGISAFRQWSLSRRLQYHLFAQIKQISIASIWGQWSIFSQDKQYIGGVEISSERQGRKTKGGLDGIQKSGAF